jgi:phytol kinase
VISFTPHELLTMGGVAGASLGILLVAEAVHHWLKPKTEWTRKLVHFSMGFLSASLPFLFDRPLPVLALCGILAVTFAGTRILGLLPSVHGVRRFTGGVLYYPAAVALLFLLSADRPGFYIASILVLTICDTLAALVGGAYGRFTYQVQGDSKSLEGSTVFFLTALLCIHVPLLLLTPIGRAESLLVALLIALLVTLLEALSVGGIDNVIIPYGTYFILERITDEPVRVITKEFCILALVAVVVLVFSRIPKNLMSSGIVAVILMAYGTWTLGDPSWFLPVILLVAWFSTLWAVFRRAPGTPAQGYELREVFHVFLVPFMILWTANSWGLYDPLFIPFLSALTVAFGFLLFAWLTIVQRGRERTGPILRSTAASAGAMLFLFLPSLLFHRAWSADILALSGATCMVLTFLLCIYWEFRLKGTRDFLRAIAFGQAITAPLVFSIQALGENPHLSPVLFLRQVESFLKG